MIKKIGKSPWISFVKKSVGALFVAETAAFAGSYYLWYRLNTNQGELNEHLVLGKCVEDFIDILIVIFYRHSILLLHQLPESAKHVLRNR